MIRKLIKRIINPHTYSSEAYVRYLKYMGVEVGVGCKIYSPNQTYIDIQRTHMLHIGNYVRISRNATILTHDYSRSVVAMCLHDNVGEAGVTWIGDNVFIGVNATILMGTHIGNNTIVGAGGCYPVNIRTM